MLLFVFIFIVRAASADQAILKNGDRVTGKIQKKDGANLVIKSDLFGTVTIPWTAVAQLTSDEPLTVALVDGKLVQGKIAVRDDALEVATQTGRQSVAVAQVKAIRNADEQKAYERLQHPGILSLWAGYADVGMSLARGNSATETITTSIKTSRETQNDKIALYFIQIYSQGKLANATTAVTAKSVRGGWAYNRNFSPRLFVNTFNDYEYDAFQGLDLRLVAGAGLGYQAIKKERTELNLASGVSYDRENFTQSLTRNSAEVYWGNNFMHRISKTTTITQSFRMFDNLTDPGQYRFNFDFGTGTMLRKWLSWQLTFSDRYLSNPQPGRKTNDVLLTTGLRFTFER
jgi:hypothetical protein